MTKFALYSHTEGIITVVEASDVAVISEDDHNLVLVTKDGRHWVFDFLEYVSED